MESVHFRYNGEIMEKDIKEYTPSILRKAKGEKREVAYAIGEMHGHEYGMWKGPVPNEKEMLEVIGRSNNSVIIRFNTDGTHKVIWKWEDTRWIRI